MTKAKEPAALALGLLVGFIAGLWVGGFVGFLMFGAVVLFGVCVAYWMDMHSA